MMTPKTQKHCVFSSIEVGRQRDELLIVSAMSVVPAATLNRVNIPDATTYIIIHVHWAYSILVNE